MNKDIYQKIAENADDKTASLLLRSIKEMNKDMYYQLIFGKRYPDLIQYRKEGESLKQLYLRMLETIVLLKEEFKTIYKEGNPEQILLNGKTINTILIWSTRNGNLKLIKWALRNGADIHAYDDTALRIASEKGYLEVVKILVEQGANIHARDDQALRIASEKGHLEVVKYLVEHGANIHANHGQALKWANVNRHFEVAKYLVEKGAKFSYFKINSEKEHLEAVK